MAYVKEILPVLMSGAMISLKLFALTLILSLPLGLVLTFAINYAAYFAEIYRGGFNSIDKGQYEAAYSLGFTQRQTLTKVVIPQMFRIVIPPISNEVITLIKDTALASTITLAEMMKVSQGIVNRDGTLIPYVMAAGIYLLFTFAMTIGLGRAEAKYSQY